MSATVLLLYILLGRADQLLRRCGLILQNGDEQAAAKAWQAKCEALQAQLRAFWLHEDRRRHLMEALVNLHLPISASELADWHSDPETWYHVNEGVLGEDDPRGVTEILLRVRELC